MSRSEGNKDAQQQTNSARMLRLMARTGTRTEAELVETALTHLEQNLRTNFSTLASPQDGSFAPQFEITQPPQPKQSLPKNTVNSNYAAIAGLLRVFPSDRTLTARGVADGANMPLPDAIRSLDKFKDMDLIRLTARDNFYINNQPPAEIHPTPLLDSYAARRPAWRVAARMAQIALATGARGDKAVIDITLDAARSTILGGRDYIVDTPIDQ
jgi:hypothetical protein